MWHVSGTSNSYSRVKCFECTSAFVNPTASSPWLTCDEWNFLIIFSLDVRSWFCKDAACCLFVFWRSKSPDFSRRFPKLWTQHLVPYSASTTAEVWHRITWGKICWFRNQTSSSGYIKRTVIALLHLLHLRKTATTETPVDRAGTHSIRYVASGTSSNFVYTCPRHVLRLRSYLEEKR